MASPTELEAVGRDEIRDRLTAIAPYYLEQWDPETEDVGTALLATFASMAGDLTERVERAPANHRVAFTAALGFEREPPQAADVPVTVTLDPDGPAIVPIEGGTEFVAETDEDELVLRLGGEDAFEATAHRLTDVVTVDPTEDRLWRHDATIDGDAETTLFAGTDRQDHVLFVGHAGRIGVEPEETIRLRIETDAPLDHLDWAVSNGDEDDTAWTAVPDEHVTWERPMLTLRAPAAVEPATVDGIETAWVRGELPRAAADHLDLHVDELTLEAATHDAPVDGYYANDVPLVADGDPITPFGTEPQRRDAFYLASEAAFTKSGAEATVTFRGVRERDDIEDDLDDIELNTADVEVNPPRLSWEYSDGHGWRSLGVSDAHDVFDGDEEETSVSFTVPEDLAAVAVAGEEGHWIRARLVGGEYVLVLYEHDQSRRPAASRRRVAGDAPAFEHATISFAYDDATDPEAVASRNALSYRQRPVDDSFAPFEPLPGTVQTLYLGFEGPVAGGPIQCYVDVEDDRRLRDRTPRLRWEYHDPDAGWVRLPTADGTEGLTRAGLVAWSFPTAPAAATRFGRHAHWIRARVRGDRFPRLIVPATIRFLALGPAAGLIVPARADAAVQRRGSTSGPCRPAVSLPASADGTGAAVVSGLHLNAAVASHVELVDDEVLGASNGDPGQVMTVDRPPAIELALWVDEARTLSTDARERLLDERPEDVELEWRDDELHRAWVRWTAVTDLGASADDDRHYELNRIDGTVTFGDGSHGRIPPRGRENVRASYRTGGGADGNVDPGAVADLGTAHPHVEAVANPVAGTGGAPAESTDAVIERAPGAIRHRGRAVTQADYERIATDAARELARARCIHGMNRQGERAPGWVTILLVPDEAVPRPDPDPGLVERVTVAVADRAPQALLARDRLVVRGPTYVPLDVEATVVGTADAAIGPLERAIEETVSEELHPLTGNGEAGWPFGSMPGIGDVIGTIEGIAGVDHVPALRLHYADRAAITKGEQAPVVPEDALVTAGSIDLTVRPGGSS